MKKIVVATDFSPAAENAMRYALHLAPRIGAGITVIHFVHPTQLVDNNVWAMYFTEDLLEAKNEALSHWVGRFSATGVTINSLCQVDYLTEGIMNYVAEQSIDLLIIGSTGATGISGILGSNAASIISNTQIPAIIVPIDARPTDVVTVTLATDFSPLTNANKEQLTQLCTALAIPTVTVLHVYKEGDSIPKAEAETQLKTDLAPIDLQFHYIKHEDVNDAIHEFLVQQPVNLLCSITHQHSFLQSLFRKNKVKTLVNQATIPILVLHG